jgi:hypothetical protein
MSVDRHIIVNMGIAVLVPGDFLIYKLAPSNGNPRWVYACQDRQIFSVTTPQPLYQWFLVNNGPTPTPLWVPTDRPPNVDDIYIVGISFAQTRSYRLQIASLHAGAPPTAAIVVQDIIYTSDNPTDSFREPFTVSVQ